MIEDFSRIVVPIDGSALAASAVSAAAAVARRAEVPVTLFGIAVDEVERHEVLRSVESLVAAAANEAPIDAVVEARGAVARSPEHVASSIVDEARRDGALVCMASHGRSGVGAMVLGSTTEAVLCQSAQPILVVGPHHRLAAAAPPQDRRIVVALDGSDLAERSLAPATAWARRFGSVPWLVQVAEPFAGTSPDVGRIGDAWETNYVRRLARTIPGAEYDILHSDDVAHELAGLPERWPVELLVVASHGRTGFRRVALGSVAMRVVHRTVCPVLVIPPDRVHDGP